MKYAVIKVTDGNFNIHGEGWADAPEKAKVSYHGLCQSLWNDPNVLNAYAAVIDEQLDVVDGCKEFIHHEPQPEPTPEPEPEEPQE